MLSRADRLRLEHSSCRGYCFSWWPDCFSKGLQGGSLSALTYWRGERERRAGSCGGGRELKSMVSEGGKGSLESFILVFKILPFRDIIARWDEFCHGDCLKSFCEYILAMWTFSTKFRRFPACMVVLKFRKQLRSFGLFGRLQL